MITLIDDKEITFAFPQESDFEDFRDLRFLVMRPHFERQDIPWSDEEQNINQREHFDTDGLRIIMWNGERVGYIGLHQKPDDERTCISRFCIYPKFQKQGLGTAVIKKTLSEPTLASRGFFLETLLLNPVRKLYESFGFIKIGENDILAYYERPARTSSLLEYFSFKLT